MFTDAIILSKITSSARESLVVLGGVALVALRACTGTTSTVSDVNRRNLPTKLGLTGLTVEEEYHLMMGGLGQLSEFYRGRSCRVKDLKDFCGGRGLSRSGRKSELADRLLSHLASAIQIDT